MESDAERRMQVWVSRKYADAEPQCHKQASSRESDGQPVRKLRGVDGPTRGNVNTRRAPKGIGIWYLI